MGPDGELVVRVGDALWCLDPDGDEPRWCRELPGLRDHATSDGVLWAIDDARRLLRVRMSDGEVTEVANVPDVGPLATFPWATNLVAAGGSVSWLASCGGGAPSIRALGAWAVVLPLGADRAVVAREGRVELRRGDSAVWSVALAAAGRPEHGSLLLEGRLAVIVTRRAGSDAVRLHVIGSRDGMLHHTLTVNDARQIAFAPRRGLAVVQIGERRLSILDLRLGRVVRTLEEQQVIHGVTVDAGLTRVALRLGEPARLVTATGAALLTSSVVPDAGSVSLAPEHAERPPEPSPSAEAVDDPPCEPLPPLHVPVLRALAPAATAPPASAEEAAVELQARLRWIGALVDRAIAEGWDSGRIAAPADSALPFELEVTATLLHATGRAQPQLERANRHLAHYEGVRADVEARREGRATPLSRLAAEVGLSPLAVDLLVAIAAPQLWGELARPYGILANDPARPLVDELLLQQLFAPRASRAEIARELDRDHPLRSAGLVYVDSRRVRPFAALRLEPLVLGILRDVEPEAELDDIRVRPADVSLENVRVPREVLLPVLGALAAEPMESRTLRAIDLRSPLRDCCAVRLLVRGRLGSGRRTLLAALAAAAGRQLGVIDGAAGDEDHAARAARIARALHNCRMLGWLPCVDGLEDLAIAEHPAAGLIRAVLRAHPGPLALRWPTEATAPLDPGYLELALPPLNETTRTQVWSDVLASHGLPADDAAELAARYRVGPGIISHAVAAAARALERAEQPVTAGACAAAVESSVRQHLDERLSAIATRVTRLAGWADLVVPEDILDSLLDLVSRVRHRRLVFERWGYDRRVSTGRGITALFRGSPGTGKTLAAGVIARELGLDLYRIDVSRVVSKWVGETEKNLAAVFDAAEDGQVVLLFDEADSLFTKRTEVKSSVDRYANLEVNYLLQRLDSFDGIALLTSNFGGSIDPAFRRRLSASVNFPFPDEEMRERIWAAHVPPEVPRVGELDLPGLARRFRLSGGFIRNAALRAAFLAAEEGSALTQQHLERAVRLEYQSMGKLSDGGTLE